MAQKEEAPKGKRNMNTRGLFDLTEGERLHLKTLWHEQQTVLLLDKCFRQKIDQLRSELEATTIEEPFRVVQGQLAVLRMVWKLLEETALQDAHTADKVNGQEVPRLI